MSCPMCGNDKLNIVTKNVVKEYTTWDCECGAHGTVKKGIIYPRFGVDDK